MKNIRGVLEVLVPVAMLGFASCATTETTVGDSDSLGIARFATEESGDLTTVTGFDASGVEVGHVTISHGVYTASPEFAADFSSSTVDGRTLTVNVGSQAYHWETEGYAPTLSLPAAPGNYVAMGTFLEQREVVDVMKKWGIGFEKFVATSVAEQPSLDGELSYSLCPDGATAGYHTFTAGSQSGTGGVKYTNVTSVSLPNGKSANTCGAMVAAPQLGVITATINSISQYVIFQECDLSGDRLWKKTCPATGTTSQCGTGTGACVGCGYFTDAAGDYFEYTDQFGRGHQDTVDSFNITNGGTLMNGKVTIYTLCY